MKVDILAIGVHPDDIELCAAGTLDSTFGSGLFDSIMRSYSRRIGYQREWHFRLKEAEIARKIFGDHVPRVNLGMADGFFTHDEHHILRIAKVIRLFQPEIVLCNAISDRHPDHGRASKLISDACFFSGLRKIKTTEAMVSNKMHGDQRRCTITYRIEILKLILWWIFLIIWIRRLETIMAYSSQFFNPDSDEPSTPISGLDFIEFIKAKNRTYARDIGAEYAEGFTVERTIGVNNLFDLK
jgi:bacillithiol biosynthesis deacetylase BshB1